MGNFVSFMEFKLEFNNKTKTGIQENFLQETLEKTLACLGAEYSFLKGKSLNVSLAAVPEDEIRKLNKEYRQMDCPTDVLSFSEYSSPEELKNAVDKEMFLGEIILCYNYIAEYAKENGEEVQAELARVVSHGLLHLLGFSHGKEMFGIQDEVIRIILQ